MKIPDPIFIGFRVKKIEKAFEEISDCGIDQVCSVSDCLIERPPGWIERWDFNDAACYNTEAIAIVTLPPGQESQYDLFAYELFPMEFSKGDLIKDLDVSTAFDWSALGPMPEEPDLSGYDMIGFDLASCSTGLKPHLGFECSPLSCNYCAKEHPVNRFCLIDDLQNAVEIAKVFANTEPEPGPYYMIKIWRHRSPHKT